MTPERPRTAKEPRARGYPHLRDPRASQALLGAPFNGLARAHRTGLIRASTEPERAKSQCLSQKALTDNIYYVKLAPGTGPARHVPTTPLAFLHPGPSEHVSSQPRGFFLVLEKCRTEWPKGAEVVEPVGRGQGWASRKAVPWAARERVQARVCDLQPPSTGVSIPECGAFSACGRRVSPNGFARQSAAIGGGCG